MSTVTQPYCRRLTQTSEHDANKQWISVETAAIEHLNTRLPVQYVCLITPA